MTTALFALALLVVLVALVAGALAAVLRSDGYGVRPAPRSHEPWTADGWPSIGPGRLAV